jgi:transcription elongation factor Elf1
MDESLCQNLINNIIKLEDKETNELITKEQITITKIQHKYSNTKNDIWRLFINSNLIKRNNNYKIYYNCIFCNREVICNLNNILRKLNRNVPRCIMCVNLDEKKRDNHSNNFYNYKLGLKENGEIKTVQQYKFSSNDFILISKLEFEEEMDEEYKNNYFKKHLTYNDFERISNKIISFQNDKFIFDKNKFEYIPYIKIGNQTQFNPSFYDKERDMLEKINYIKFQCEQCNNYYTFRDLFKLKNKYKVLCQDCTFCNNTFKLRHTKNIINEKISYNSKYELKFIKYCNDNNIIINDGPRLKYNHIISQKELNYVVDFYIPKLNIIIELKDNHKWHKDQIKNETWRSKMRMIKEQLDNKNFSEYLLIFPKNYVKMTKYILQKYNE